MNKIFLVVFIATVIALPCVANDVLSYTNNTYQKLADEYSKKAEKAFDAGHYDDAQEYANMAAENAALSKAFIDRMLLRDEAAVPLKQAQDRVDWAKSVGADKTSPIYYSDAVLQLANAQDSFSNEDYAHTKEYAAKTLAALKDVKAAMPLPEYYVVRPWKETGDCLWNITKRPYVYNNPYLWENIYDANKEIMNIKDPNVIQPGQKLRIPSIAGEYRTGLYDPTKEYAVFGEE